jgi:RNA polymerase sigma-70 factor (ECF subfamily)
MSANGQDESDLLSRACGGDVVAFEEVVRRYQRRVYGVALRIVRRHDVADDVTQDAFLRAHQALSTFDTTRPFGLWVCRIAANLAINHVRSPKAREEGLPDGHAETPSPTPGPLAGLLDREAHDRLKEAMALLSPEQRAVFVLRAVEGLSYKEIAEALDVSPGTVMSRLFRARERLVLALGPYLGEARRRAGVER